MGREHTNRDYEQELRKLREQILLMGAKVEESITGSIRALTERDTTLAERVIERDVNIDAYYQQIFRELLTYMMEDPRNIHRATRLQSIAKYLERIGDHATNLAEMVVFMVKGKDIRHAGKLGRSQ